MCGSSDRSKVHDAQSAKSGGGVKFRVDDMTCGHCAASITTAIKKAVPGAEVDADPKTKFVSVRGAADAAIVSAAMAKAGFTPVAA